MYKFFLTFFFIGLQLISNAQSEPNPIWINENYIHATAGTSGQVHIHKDNNIYLISGAFNGIIFYRIFKYDSLGNEIWSNEYHSWSNNFNDMTLDKEGNAYVSFEIGKYLPEFISLGKLVKYNSETGEIDWENTYDESYYPADKYITNCAVDSLNRVLVYGSSYDYDSFPDTSGTAFLFCHDADTGAEIWRKEWAGLVQTEDLKVINDHTIVLVSYSFDDSLGWHTVIQHLDYDGNELSKGIQNGSESVGVGYITNEGALAYGDWHPQDGAYGVTKISSNGDTLWHYEAANPGNFGAYLKGIQDDELGNIYTTGTLSPDTLKDFKRVTSKFSPSGDLLWQKTYELNPDSSFIDDGWFLSVDSSTVLTIGYSYNDSFYLVIVAYDRETGDELFVAKVVDIPTGDQVLHYKDGFVFTSTVWRGNDAYLYIGRFRVPKFTSSVNVNTSKIGAISPYPNPTSNSLFVENIDLDWYNNYSIYSPNGALISKGMLDRETFEYDFTGLASGVYLFQLKGEKAVFTRKIVVARD